MHDSWEPRCFICITLIASKMILSFCSNSCVNGNSMSTHVIPLYFFPKHSTSAFRLSWKIANKEDWLFIFSAMNALKFFLEMRRHKQTIYKQYEYLQKQIKSDDCVIQITKPRTKTYFRKIYRKFANRIENTCISFLNHFVLLFQFKYESTASYIRWFSVTFLFNNLQQMFTLSLAR